MLTVPGNINEFFLAKSLMPPFALYCGGIAEINNVKQAMSLTAITQLNVLQIYTLAGVLYFIIYKVFTLLAGVFEKTSHQFKP